MTTLHSYERERAVIGRLMFDATTIAHCDLLTAGDFFDPTHAAIFGAVVALSKTEKSFDAIAAFEHLNSLGIDVGGLANLALLTQIECSGTALRAHVEKLRELSARRAMASLIESRPFSEIGEAVAKLAESVAPRATGFAVVPMTDLTHTQPPAYIWDGYLPVGVVTLLSAHGGTGKSMLSLMVGVTTALGMPLFGVPTQRRKVCFFSGEDGTELLRHRLRWICDKLSINPADLDGWLHVLDATNDPVLFHEIAEFGSKRGATTQAFSELRHFLVQHEIGLLIVDNASDSYDADEINRARVRGFMRALGNVAKHIKGAVLLLAHVDKTTARGAAAGSDSYSGSTAWHNSARSRLFLSRDKDGGLLLEHQKHNLGRLREPLRLSWPEGGIPQADQPLSGFVQHLADNSDGKVLVKLIHQFYGRHQYVATDVRSRYNAVKLLTSEPTFPKRRSPREVFRMLDDAEFRGYIVREQYKDANRKAHERWQVTPAGQEFAGIAPCAPCAPSTTISELSHTAQMGAPSAPCSARGYGGVERAQNTAQGVSHGN